MDSGNNSGSLHSSSGGDDEYDSRASADHHNIFMATQPPPAPLFDPFSNYTQPLLHPNPLQNPNPPWPGSAPLRSDPNPHSQSQTFLNPFMPSFQTPPPPPPPQSDTAAATTTAAAPPTAARNPRKRSRASRRAPTTVLTTDTTNFRAMVQEFTGIPAPPFTGPSFPRPNRLDTLLASRSALEAAATPYLRRPFSHRGPTPPPPFFLPTSATNNNDTNNNLLLSINNSNQNNDDNNNNNNNQSQNQLFTSLLQTSPSKFVFSGGGGSSATSSSKPAFDFQPDDIKTRPGLDAFGLGVGHGTYAANDLPSLVSSDRAGARNDGEDDENAAKWRRNNSSSDANQGYNQARMKSGGFDFSGPNSSGPGPDNSIPTSRVGDQGMVESWIFSSD
ncbi:VQ motif-containing protein [Striga hermonthica]|uniref:VQ motif-containing protein n=1 Tax=Striga hermonthica TaxID=68872 RepID=A0A9N7RC61_STRHE|nr:VQ motif-containing protein [Striga hermonthica]